MNDSLTIHQLGNGLTVLLKEIHTAPIVSAWVWYGVGSRNEVPGKTGVSHWVEHMQFKGTKKRSAQDMDHTIARLGGYWNAFTSPDWTAYFETLPASALETALELEADRMTNSLFDPLEVETERTVIISEREGSENDPQFLLNEAVQAHAFKHHPYRNEVIGSKEDLLALTREDLYTHYRQTYQPANAILCLAGDFVTSQALRLVEKHFGSIPAGKVVKSIPEPEEDLPELSQLQLQGPGETTFIQVAYRSPKADSDDFFAFSLMESLLTGPSNLNMFGSGGVGHHTSRLYLAMVDEGLAAGVGGSLSANIDPSTFTLYLTKNPTRTIEEVLQTLDSQIEALQSQPIAQTEIDRALKQTKALFAYSSDNITNQAFWMGYASSFARYDWFTHYVDRISSVTPEMIQNIAQKYLQPHARVIGVYQPKDGN